MNTGIEPPTRAADIPTVTSTLGRMPKSVISRYAIPRPIRKRTTATYNPACGNLVDLDVSCILMVMSVTMAPSNTAEGSTVYKSFPITGVTYRNVTTNRTEKTIPTPICLYQRRSRRRAHPARARVVEVEVAVKERASSKPEALTRGASQMRRPVPS